MLEQQFLTEISKQPSLDGLYKFFDEHKEIITLNAVSYCDLISKYIDAKNYILFAGWGNFFLKLVNEVGYKISKQDLEALEHPLVRNMYFLGRFYSSYLQGHGRLQGMLDFSFSSVLSDDEITSDLETTETYGNLGLSQEEKDALLFAIRVTRVKKELYHLYDYSYSNTYSGWHAKAVRYETIKFCDFLQAEFAIETNGDVELSEKIQLLSKNCLSNILENKNIFAEIIATKQPLALCINTRTGKVNHALGLLIFGNILVFSNAGFTETKEKRSYMDFYVIDDSLAASDLLDKIAPWEYALSGDFERKIETADYLKQIGSLSVKSQEGGSCGWKAFMHSMQAIFILTRASKISSSHISLEDLTNSSQSMLVCFDELYNTFKLKRLRDAVIDPAMKQALLADPDTKEMLLDMHEMSHNSTEVRTIRSRQHAHEVKLAIGRTAREYAKALMVYTAVPSAVLGTVSSIGGLGLGWAYSRFTHSSNPNIKYISAASVGLAAGALGCTLGFKAWMRLP